jgi:hypothetical protein
MEKWKNGKGKMKIGYGYKNMWKDSISMILMCFGQDTCFLCSDSHSTRRGFLPY